MCLCQGNRVTIIKTITFPSTISYVFDRNTSKFGGLLCNMYALVLYMQELGEGDGQCSPPKACGGTWRTMHCRLCINVTEPASEWVSMIFRYIDGAFPDWGDTRQRFCYKTQKGPAKCVNCVCVLCMVYSFPPCGWNLRQVGRQFLWVVDNNKVWGIWFGLAECLIFHS